MQNTHELLDKMDSYTNRLATPPDYEKQSAKFLLGVRIFKEYCSEFVEMKRGGACL